MVRATTKEENCMVVFGLCLHDSAKTNIRLAELEESETENESL